MPAGQARLPRDGKRNTLQIEFGLLCNRDGCPVAVEVFDGNADPSTVSVQVEKLQRRFGLQRVVLVGDRGMLTEARIREDRRPALTGSVRCARRRSGSWSTPVRCRPLCSTNVT